MRFLPARALCEPIKSAAQSRAEEESRALETTPAGGCTPIGSHQGVVYRNIDQRGSPKTTRWRAPNNRPGESGAQECAWSDQRPHIVSRAAPESCTTPLSAGPEAG